MLKSKIAFVLLVAGLGSPRISGAEPVAASLGQRFFLGADAGAVAGGFINGQGAAGTLTQTFGWRWGSSGAALSLAVQEGLGRIRHADLGADLFLFSVGPRLSWQFEAGSRLRIAPYLLLGVLYERVLSGECSAPQPSAPGGGPTTYTYACVDGDFVAGTAQLGVELLVQLNERLHLSLQPGLELPFGLGGGGAVRFNGRAGLVFSF